jgi:hypothetical protein
MPTARKKSKSCSGKLWGSFKWYLEAPPQHMPVCGAEEKKVFSKGRQQKKVKARSLLCYWAVREAGISLRTLAKRLRVCDPGVGYAVERGEAIVQENHYELTQ